MKSLTEGVVPKLGEKIVAVLEVIEVDAVPTDTPALLPARVKAKLLPPLIAVEEVANPILCPENIATVSNDSLPRDGKEAVGAALQNQASRYYYSGQLPPMNILNPSAWRSFINSWKRGDYKSKSK